MTRHVEYVQNFAALFQIQFDFGQQGTMAAP